MLHPLTDRRSFRLTRAVAWACLCLAVLAPGAVRGDDKSDALAARIDEHVRAQWAAGKMVPSARADDATFLRRVSLHVAGAVPPVSVTREFLADTRPDKRGRYVEELLAGPEYAANFARVWREAMLPRRSGDFFRDQSDPTFETWLQRQLIAGRPFDETVRRVVASGGASQEEVLTTFASPAGFAQSRGAKPEEVAAGAVRVFLGVRLECAQCHDHPFDTWKQNDFWSVAAFFTPRDPAGEGGPWSIKVAGTGRTVSAAFLDGTRAEAADGASGREVFADWVTSPRNPRFAAATANRLWGHFFGVGLVEPVDDFSDHNPASHPELLDLLAREFVESGHDLKHLIRSIAASETYQLSGVRSDPSQDEVRLYGRMRSQGLTPSQLALSVRRVIGGAPAKGVDLNNFPDGFPDPVAAPVLEAFPPRTGSALEQDTSILQALFLMNGLSLMADRSRGPDVGVVQALAGAPFLSSRQKVETLYLAALCRPPTADEWRRLEEAKLVGDKPIRGTAELADILWVLVNSSEFQLNH